MTEEFLAVFKIIGWKRIEEGGHRVPTGELVRQMRADPAALEWERSFVEHILTTVERAAGEALLRLLFSTTCYLSNLLEGPVPVLLPRGDVQALHAADRDEHGAALSLARSLKHLVRTQAAALQQPHDERLVAKLEELVSRVAAGGVPSDRRYMSTEQIAAWLGLVPKTVRRLFNEKKLIGKKVGNEWRATREQIEDSPYMQRGRRRGRASVE